MSAGFKVAGEEFLGTNGAVEAYVEALAALAGDHFGLDDPLTAFLRDERDGFFLGKVVLLDERLQDDTARSRFLLILDAATEQLLREGTWSQYGQQWVSEVVSRLRDRIAGGVP
jgi:hypothetical protein